MDQQLGCAPMRRRWHRLLCLMGLHRAVQDRISPEIWYCGWCNELLEDLR